MEPELTFDDASRTKGREATRGVIPGRFALSVGLPDLPTPEGWRWTPLSEVARLESGHTPSRKYPEYWDGGVPWIGIKDAVDNHGRTIDGTYQHVSALGLANSSARLLPKDTVCLSRTASVGYVVVMGMPMSTSQDFVNWVCGPPLHHHYLKYVLLAERDSILRFASGTTHQTMYYPEAKALHVALPAVKEQHRIASVLGALDNKIELNRKMNRTLEEMAQAIFKSWFVDFDGHNDLVESELGLIPKSWEIEKVENLATRVAMGPFGSRITVDNFVSSGVPVIRGQNLADGFIDRGFVFLTESKAEELRASMAFSGDLVFTHRGTLGQIGRIPRQTVHAKYVVSQSQMLLSPDESRASSAFLYFFFRAAGMKQLLTFASTTGVPAIGRPSTSLKSIKLVLPPKALCDRFTVIAEALESRRCHCVAQSRTLSALRDTLLPKLISGEIRVPEAEKEVEAML